MRILLDADTLLEFVLNRSIFINKVEDLSKIIQFDGIEVCISSLGFDKVINSIESLVGSRKPKEFNIQVKKLRRKFKILKVTKPIAHQARLSPTSDFESAVEICLAIKEGIGAIVTHRSNDFLGESANILTVDEFQQRKCLEERLLKGTNNTPCILTMKPQQIATLNKIYYNLPSHKNIKSPKSKPINIQSDDSLTKNHEYRSMNNSLSALAKISELSKPTEMSGVIKRLSDYHKSLNPGLLSALEKGSELSKPTGMSEAIKGLSDYHKSLNPGLLSALVKGSELSKPTGMSEAIKGLSDYHKSLNPGLLSALVKGSELSKPTGMSEAIKRLSDYHKSLNSDPLSALAKGSKLSKPTGISESIKGLNDYHKSLVPDPLSALAKGSELSKPTGMSEVIKRLSNYHKSLNPGLLSALVKGSELSKPTGMSEAIKRLSDCHKSLHPGLLSALAKGSELSKPTGISEAIKGSRNPR
jgi:hypothetical protein